MPTILVVDDEPGICLLLSAVLMQSGFSVLTARNAADAISISQAHPGEIELVITELGRPNVDGPAIARALSIDEPDLPVLFMSGRWDPCEQDGLETLELLTKPFTIETLLKAVHSLLPEAAPYTVN